jgi:hypothetical protein
LCQNNGGIGAMVALLLIESLTGLPIMKKPCIQGKATMDGFLGLATGVTPLPLNRCSNPGTGRCPARKDPVGPCFRGPNRAEMDELAWAGKDGRVVDTTWQVLEAACKSPVEDSP